MKGSHTQAQNIISRRQRNMVHDNDWLELLFQKFKKKVASRYGEVVNQNILYGRATEISILSDRRTRSEQSAEPIFKTTAVI